MHSSIILTPLLAGMALANPVVKRYLTTQIEVFTVWTTVTADSAAPTAPADGYDYYYGSSSMSPEAPMSSEAPISSEAPMPSEAPTSSEAPMFYVSSASSQAPAASSSSVPNTGSDSLPSYAKDILYQHNIHRANHSDTGAMTWSDALAATALKHAKNCIFEHNTDIDKDQYPKGYGQNIQVGSPPEGMPSAITDGMYNKEFENYKDFWGKDEVAWESGPGMWGHMTQIVWRETTEVGCATFKCPQPVASANPDFPPYSSVCNYYPPGNVMGHFTSVGTPLGKPVVIVDADAYKY